MHAERCQLIQCISIERVVIYNTSSEIQEQCSHAVVLSGVLIQEVLLSTRRPFASLELNRLIGIGNLLSLGLRPTDGGIINRFSFRFFRGLFRCTLRRLARRLG